MSVAHHETSLEEIPQMVFQARVAQKTWASKTVKQRAEIILNAREHILNNLDEIAALISSENGKPSTEAIVHDILPVLELMTAYCKRAPKLLEDKPLSLRIMKHKKSYLHYWPVGVVAVIAPWNFPFSIPFGESILALLSGNAVILKPSEVTPKIGLKIGEILDAAGLPRHLFQIVLGTGVHGAKIIQSGVNKVFFTGSVSTGKKVMAAASDRLTPVILELGGKDPMIVLSDADLDFATSAALWGGFANSGQVCASIERIIVHESIHDKFVSKLNEKIARLNQTDDQSSLLKNFGRITFEKQKDVYSSQLQEVAQTAAAKISCGGTFSPDRKKLDPTVVIGNEGARTSIERLRIYNEETFGPVVAVTTFKSIEEAVEKANHSPYGLLASVISEDIHLAESVARQIEAGTVLINDVLYTHGLAETPWGGVKDTGFGRVHSDLGLYEFVNVRHIHKDRFAALRFKPLWWFPYTGHQLKMFRYFMEFMYRRTLSKRLSALPHMLAELVQMIKNEPRI